MTCAVSSTGTSRRANPITCSCGHVLSGTQSGGDSFWYTTVEYSLPIIEQPGGVGLRLAAFFDAGSVGPGPWSFSGNYDSDWGLEHPA